MSKGNVDRCHVQYPPSNVSTIWLRTGINELVIQPKCWAYSRYFTLPAILKGTSDIDIRHVALETFNLSQFVNNFMNESIKSSGHGKLTPTDFKFQLPATVSEIALTKLQDELRYGFGSWGDTHLKVKKSSMTALLVSLILFGIVAVALTLFLVVRKRQIRAFIHRLCTRESVNEPTNPAPNSDPVPSIFETSFIKLSPLRRTIPGTSAEGNLATSMQV